MGWGIDLRKTCLWMLTLLSDPKARPKPPLTPPPTDFRARVAIPSPPAPCFTPRIPRPSKPYSTNTSSLTSRNSTHGEQWLRRPARLASRCAQPGLLRSHCRLRLRRTLDPLDPLLVDAHHRLLRGPNAQRRTAHRLGLHPLLIFAWYVRGQTLPPERYQAGAGSLITLPGRSYGNELR